MKLKTDEFRVTNVANLDEQLHSRVIYFLRTRDKVRDI